MARLTCLQQKSLRHSTKGRLGGGGFRVSGLGFRCALGFGTCIVQDVCPKAVGCKAFAGFGAIALGHLRNGDAVAALLGTRFWARV